MENILLVVNLVLATILVLLILVQKSEGGALGIGVSAIFGMFAGVYHWFPKMYGKMMNKTLGYWHFWITITAAYGVFFPMHFIGLAGLPRRYYTNTNFPLFDDLSDINVVITMFALLGGLAQLIFLANFFISIYKMGYVII